LEVPPSGSFSLSRLDAKEEELEIFYPLSFSRAKQRLPFSSPAEKFSFLHSFEKSSFPRRVEWETEKEVRSSYVPLTVQGSHSSFDSLRDKLFLSPLFFPDASLREVPLLPLLSSSQTTQRTNTQLFR